MTTTVIAPTNIAILKYWGKQNAEDMPTKSSLSFTASDLCTTTKLTATKGGSGEIKRFKLNGKQCRPDSPETRYLQEFVGKVAAHYPFVNNYSYEVDSKNNFPTAAGFASSASGFAAFTVAMVKEIPEFAPIRADDKKISATAKLCSGSAARSIPRAGGFVIWHRGSNYESSFAETLFSHRHWPELKMVYATVESKEKKVKSRKGMATSIETNEFYDCWVEHEEGEMKAEMITAMKEKDFGKLAVLIMKASNNLHAVCLGSYPPLIYLNDKSFKIIDAVHRMNDDAGKPIAAGEEILINYGKNWFSSRKPRIAAICARRWSNSSLRTGLMM